MTLEPVHIKAMSDLVKRIDVSVDEKDMPDTVVDILQHLHELRYDGRIILKSLGRVFRGKVNIDRMALSRDPFAVTYACDSGCTNPIPLNNGIYVDFCHCGIASTPSDLDLHSKRTIVAATYSPSREVMINTTTGWELFDGGNGRASIIRIQPGLLKKRIKRMVHDIALYLSESEHMLWIENRFDPEGLFIMDGPIYPKQLMYWMAVGSEDVEICYDPVSSRILQNYIDLMDRFLAKKRPIIGFVKNPADMQIMRTLRKNGQIKGLPWSLDEQLFKKILSPAQGQLSGTGTSEKSRRSERSSRYITYTNWFLQPNQFYENLLDTTSPIMEDSLTHKFPAEEYALAFFVVYVPSLDVLFKIESPYGIVRDEDMRQLITRKVLYDISVNKIPLTLSKADSLAKIKASEKKEIVARFEELKVDTVYNDIRWGEQDE